MEAKLTEAEKAQLKATEKGIRQIENGEGIAWSKVRFWMLSLGTKNELPRPKK